MPSDRERPDVLRTPAAEKQAVEDRTLDAALQDAAKEIAESLRREEVQHHKQQLQRHRKGLSWGSALLLVFVGLMVAFMWPDRVENAPSAIAGLTFENSISLSSGEFTLHLPKGFERKVSIVALENGRYQFIGNNLNTDGVYTIVGQRLKMETPNDPRLTEFEWLVEDSDHLRLVVEPPVGKTGARYVGATLTRKEELED